jgi:ubiquitin-protein ligase
MESSNNSNAKVKDTLLNLQSIFASPELAENLLHKTLLIEFKHLQKFCPSGVYILPQFDNISIWHGVVFVRDGYYKNGIFKFKIKISNKYPNVEPQVIFFKNISSFT